MTVLGTGAKGSGTLSGTVRWGVIGTGGIAAKFVADLALLPDAEVVAVGSRSADGAADFGDRFQIDRRHASYADLVADPDIDAVYIATPHPFHAEHALQAIAAGKPVLVEKPFAMNAGEARSVVDAARAAGVFCMEAMWTRFLPHMIRLRELLAEGALGEILAVSADQGMRFEPDPEHRLFAPELGGGALLDLGIYPFSFASMVLGVPETVRASATSAFTGVDQTTSAVLTYSGGAHAVVICTSAAATPMRAWVAGTQGRIEIDRPWYQATSFTLTRMDGSTERYETPAGVVQDIAQGRAKGMRFEAAELGRCLRAGLLESPVMPLDETVSILGTLDEVRDQIGLSYATRLGK
ncbi:MAG TPA: Gfo/Idh/MocA family oxidoreductase [Kineosporiaceae bacterium]|nr:Gfo/Idh/MocA family oxidoreductase [Kineosporiaceae bacterium]